METAKWKWLLCLTGVSVFVWFLLKYVIVLILPLIIAFIMTRLVYPLAVRLKKARKSLPSKVCRMIVFFGYLMIIGVFFTGVVMAAVRQIQHLLENMDSYQAWLLSFLSGCCSYCDKFLGLPQGAAYQKLLLFFTEGSGDFWQEKLFKLPISAVSLFRMAGRAGVVALFSVFLTVMALMNLERWYGAYRRCGFRR